MKTDGPKIASTNIIHNEGRQERILPETRVAVVQVCKRHDTTGACGDIYEKGESGIRVESSMRLTRPQRESLDG